MPSIQTFADSANFRFRYMAYKDLAITSGAAGQTMFRLNSLFDPDYSGVGAQPRYYDALCAAAGPYSKYRVLRSHVRVQFINVNSSNTTVGYCYMRISDTTTLLSPTVDPAIYSEGADIQMGLIAINSNPNSFLTLEATVDPAKYFGSPSAYELDEFLADYNANPTDVVYMELGYRPYDLAATTTMRVVVEIIFDAELTGLTIASQSTLVQAHPTPPVSMPTSPVSAQLTALEHQVALLRLEAQKAK
jgi:hypothetical protein